MAEKEAGDRLAKALRVAMTQAGYDTYQQLALAAGVSPTTLDNWIYGVTRPRSSGLAKVAKALTPYTSAAALERAYDGLPPEEPPLHEQLKQLVDVLNEFVPLYGESLAVLAGLVDQAALEEARALVRARLRRLSARLAEGPFEPDESDEPRQ